MHECTRACQVGNLQGPRVPRQATDAGTPHRALCSKAPALWCLSPLPKRCAMLRAPPALPRSYAIAIGYVCFDTVDKYRKTLANARLKLSTRPVPDSVDLEK